MGRLIAVTIVVLAGFIIVSSQVPPLDVPAIEVDSEYSCYDARPGGGLPVPCKAWTCADKSRVLLKSEDGTLHCVDLKVIQKLGR